MTRKQFILVAGVDWQEFKTKFEFQCLERMQQLRTKHAGAPLRFTLFNFLTGEVKVMDFSSQGSSMKPVMVKKFFPFNITEYEYTREGNDLSVEFIGSTDNKLSITDIYDYVIRIGIENPGELFEMSWFNVPVYADHAAFTRAFDHIYINHNRSNIRSKKCLEPLTEIDFISPNMSNGEVTNFKNAFSAEGVIWLWQADKADFPFDELNRESALVLVKHINDLGFIPVENTLIDLIQYDSALTYFYVQEKLPRKMWFSKKIKENQLYTFGMIRYVFFKYLERTSAFYLSKSTGVNVISNSLYSFTESESPAGRNLPSIPNDLRSLNKFYSDYFKLPLDDEGRGYLVFKEDIREPILPSLREAEQLRREQHRTIDRIVRPQLPESPRVIGPDIKPRGTQIFFVSGVDFTFNGINFFDKCKQRIANLLSNFSPAVSAIFQFRIYDFQSGIVTYLDTRSMNIPVIDNLCEAIRKSDYRQETDLFGKKQFVFKGRPNAMRMNDVYADIIKLGNELPESLYELNFVCHCDEGGPITTNFKEQLRSPGVDPLISSTFDPDKIADRFLADEGDQRLFDPSAATDFSNATMSGSLLHTVQRAFHSSARIHCWFYNTSDSVLKLMKAIVNGPFELKPQHRRNSLPFIITSRQAIPELDDDGQIPLAVAGYTIEEAYEIVIKLTNPDRSLKSVLEKISGNSSSPIVMKVRLGHLVFVLAKILRASYLTHLARATQKRVYSGVPGIRTGFDSSPKENYMVINPAINKKFLNFFHAFFKLNVNEHEKNFYVFYPSENEWDKENYPDKKYEKE